MTIKARAHINQSWVDVIVLQFERDIAICANLEGFIHLCPVTDLRIDLDSLGKRRTTTNGGTKTNKG